MKKTLLFLIVLFPYWACGQYNFTHPSVQRFAAYVNRTATVTRLTRPNDIKLLNWMANRIAISCFDSGIRYYRVWDSSVVLYPMISTTDTIHSVNFITPGTYSIRAWTGSPTQNDGSFTPASGKYANTLLPCTYNSINSKSIGYYSFTNSAAGNKEEIADSGAGQDYLILRYTGNLFFARLNNTGGGESFSNSNSEGMFLGVRTASNNTNYFIRDAYVSSKTNASSAISTRNYLIGIGQGLSSDRTCGTAFFGYAMDTTHSKSFSSAITKFNQRK